MSKRNTNDPHVDFLDGTEVPSQNVVDLRALRAAAQPEASKKKAALKSGVHPRSMALRFLLFAVALVVPVAGFQFAHRTGDVKGKVLGASSQAYASLVQAGIAMRQLDAQLAQDDFAEAAASFAKARADVSTVSSAIDGLRSILPAAGQLKAGRDLLVAGESVAIAGENLSAMAAPLLTQTDDKQATTFPAFLHAAEEHLDPAADALDNAVHSLQSVRPEDLPDEYRTTFQNLATALPELSGSVSRFRDTIHIALDLLGARRPQRYLVLLQNNTELRPTGGFIGSVALIDVADGAITRLEVPGGGSYDYQGQLKANVLSPEPLHIVNPTWYLQDANWWPDFPASAKKIMWFYEKSGGPTVDAVLTMTPDVVIALLKQTGPVAMKEPYTMVITSDNFLEQVQAPPEHSDKPKQMIADLLPLVLDRLFQETSTDRLTLLGVFETALQEKQMLFYFPSQEQEDRIARLGWAGELKATDGDYLSVIDTNIGGGKTDGVIDETIEHHSTINADGTVDDTVTIKRTHFGSPDDPLTSTRNVDYVRLYVPKGSALQRTQGFERIDPKRFQAPDAGLVPDETVRQIEGDAVIDEKTGTRIGSEFGKTVFANWIGVAPGETSIATMTYRLPFTVKAQRTLFSTRPAKYSVLFQKQPGAKTRQLVSSISYPKENIVRWLSPDDPATTTKTAGNILTTADLATDKLIGIVLDAK